MRTNPFYDSWLFLIGEDAFHLGIGPWRYEMPSARRKSRAPETRRGS
jgi:hypothetical protein